MKLAYIGLGNMGLPMVINLLRAGHEVTVFDLDDAKTLEAAAAGGIPAPSGPEAVREADLVITSLPGPPQSAAAMPQIIDAMKEQAIWVDMTTNDRELVIALAEQGAPKGIRVLESPVTGAVDGARLGKLTMFIGGDAAALEEARPYLELLGKIIPTGSLGTGNVVKLITNQIWFINAAAIGEALVLGKKSGVDLLVLWDALKHSVGDTFVVRHDVPSIFDGHYDPSFSLDLCCKDLGLIEDLGAKTETQLDMTHFAQQKFEKARQKFGGDAAELLVCKLVEDASGVRVQVEGDWQKHWEA